MDEEMNPRKHFYGKPLLECNKDDYGEHPKCKGCRTRKEKGCDFIQYNARRVADFYCADYKNERTMELLIDNKKIASVKESETLKINKEEKWVKK